MVQEVQRHQPPGHPQPLTDADFLVDTHIQKIEGVVAQIDERGELTRSGRRTVERWIHLAGPRRSIQRRNVCHVRDQRRVREASGYCAQGLLQLVRGEAAAEHHTRLSEIADCVAAAI